MNTLKTVYDEGRLIRKAFSDTDDNGRELLCLLTALANDRDCRPENCPASVAPEWLVHLLPWIDDAGTEEAWHSHIDRLIPLAPKLHTLGRTAELRCKLVALNEAKKHTDYQPSIKAINDVVHLIERELTGNPPTDSAWSAAESAAESAAWSAAESAAESAARSAAWSAARSAARSAAESAADRVISEMISVFEEEIEGDSDDK